MLSKAPRPARGLFPEALHQMSTAALAKLDKTLQSLLDGMQALNEGYRALSFPFNM